MTDDVREVEEKERHPFRFLFKFAALAGLVYLAGRYLTQMKDEYTDLTESQARDKFMEKMAPRVGDETASDIADQVIPKLKERGLIKPDLQDDDRDRSSDEVSEAVDSVVKD